MLSKPSWRGLPSCSLRRLLAGRRAVRQGSAVCFKERNTKLHYNGRYCLLVDYSSPEHSETLAEGRRGAGVLGGLCGVA